MKHRRAVAAGLISTLAAVLLALVSGGMAAESTPAAEHTRNTPVPLITLPPELQFTLPPQEPQPTATPRPTPPPTETPLPSTAPVPTGPAVGTEVTPPALANVPVASIGPTPQPAASDVTLVIIIVVIGLSLLAIGAFVLALAVQ